VRECHQKTEAETVFYGRDAMDEREQRSELWSFREGTLSPKDSIKNFRVEASDGHAGKVSWASYAPGESYLVVSHMHHLHETHHVVPAGAVERIGSDERTVWLTLSRDEVEELPEHHDPPAPVETWIVDAINRATATQSLGGDMV
jgi:hypothetical protein